MRAFLKMRPYKFDEFYTLRPYDFKENLSYIHYTNLFKSIFIQAFFFIKSVQHK